MSVASLVLGICHVFFIFFLDHQIIQDPKPFKGNATIVFQDSLTGKMDTMDMEEYIKKLDK